jgi:hypothetical protein
MYGRVEVELLSIRWKWMWNSEEKASLHIMDAVGLDMMARRKIVCLCLKWNPPVIHTTANHFTDLAIPVNEIKLNQIIVIIIVYSQQQL